MIGILFFLSQKSTSHKVYPDHNINSDITKNKHVQLPPFTPLLGIANDFDLLIISQCYCMTVAFHMDTLEVMYV